MGSLVLHGTGTSGLCQGSLTAESSSCLDSLQLIQHLCDRPGGNSVSKPVAWKRQLEVFVSGVVLTFWNMKLDLSEESE